MTYTTTIQETVLSLKARVKELAQDNAKLREALKVTESAISLIIASPDGASKTWREIEGIALPALAAIEKALGGGK